MNVTAFNPPTDNLEKSYLSQAYAAGVTSVVLRQTDRFNVNDRIMIGQQGREKTEIVTVSAVNSNQTTLTIGATKFPHNADDPVYVLKYDQIKFYRSTTGISGSYSALATVAVDVDNLKSQTIYDDTTGLTSYYYKVSFYHSVAALESSLSDPIPGTGYARGTVGFLLNEFFESVNDQKQMFMSVPTAIALLNECSDDMISQSRRPYRWLEKTATLDIVASSNRVALPTDLSKLERISYERVDGVSDRTDLYRIISIEEMQGLSWDNTALDSDDLMYFALDEVTNELVIYPTPESTQADKITVTYWAKYTELDSMADVLQTPTPRAYKLFLAGRYYRERGKKDQSFLQLSDRYLADYGTEVVKLQRMNKIDVGSPQSMKPPYRGQIGNRRY